MRSLYSSLFITAMLCTTAACTPTPDDAVQLRPPGFTKFDEYAARQRVVAELDQASYESVGKPYGCTPDCRDRSLGFEAAKRQWATIGTCTWDDDALPKDESRFQQGCDAYIETLEARIAKLRREHLEGRESG